MVCQGMPPIDIYVVFCNIGYPESQREHPPLPPWIKMAREVHGAMLVPAVAKNAMGHRVNARVAHSGSIDVAPAFA